MKYTKKEIATVVITAIIVGGVNFYAGTYFPRKGQVSGLTNGTRFNGTQRAMRTGGNGLISGEVISKDETSITVKLRDGGSKIVFLTAQTPVMKSVAGILGDVNTGATVIVTGKANPDGSIAADSVQIRPAGSQQMMR
jgi:hypothetical protein